MTHAELSYLFFAKLTTGIPRPVDVDHSGLLTDAEQGMAIKRVSCRLLGEVDNHEGLFNKVLAKRNESNQL